MTSPANPSVPTDFIREAVRQDLADGTYSRVQTRFPPEPNGYLHIGHAKAIFTDFSIAEEFGRAANKRWDDASRASKGDDEAYRQALADAFRCLRTLTLLMHPVVPGGCERIAKYLRFPSELFFSWEHAFEGPVELAAYRAEKPEDHALEELPPRFDFFKKHGSQR